MAPGGPRGRAIGPRGRPWLQRLRGARSPGHPGADPRSLCTLVRTARLCKETWGRGDRGSARPGPHPAPHRSVPSPVKHLGPCVSGPTEVPGPGPRGRRGAPGGPLHLRGPLPGETVHSRQSLSHRHTHFRGLLKRFPTTNDSEGLIPILEKQVHLPAHVYGRFPHIPLASSHPMGCDGCSGPTP